MGEKESERKREMEMEKQRDKKNGDLKQTPLELRMDF